MFWLTGIVGLVALMAPFLFNYSDNTGALWTSAMIGVVLMVDSIFEGMSGDKERWEYVVAVIVGLVAVTAPFVLNFSGVSSALWTSVGIGLATLVAAGARLTSGKLK